MLRKNEKLKNLKTLKKKELELQIVDIYEHDINYRDYQICFFCVDKNSQSYCVKVNDYKPFFYILLNNEDDKNEILDLKIKNNSLWLL